MKWQEAVNNELSSDSNDSMKKSAAKTLSQFTHWNIYRFMKRKFSSSIQTLNGVFIYFRLQQHLDVLTARAHEIRRKNDFIWWLCCLFMPSFEI